jgi:hypothetical protein
MISSPEPEFWEHPQGMLPCAYYPFQQNDMDMVARKAKTEYFSCRSGLNKYRQLLLAAGLSL